MGEQVSERESLRRALTIARHDSVCAYGSSCDDGLTTYPQISDLEVNAALAWFAERVEALIDWYDDPGYGMQEDEWRFVRDLRALYTPTTESEDR